MGSLFWIVVCVLSPTRLIIEIIKKWQFVNYGKLLKLWNPGFLLVSIATCIYLSYIPKINDISNMSYGLALYILWMPFSRTFEIAYAFFLDAHDKLLNRESSTDLKFTDRIYLAMSGYLEAALNFGIIYYFMPSEQFSEKFNDITASVYYSFVTITTLGYGDIKPVEVCSRIMCIIELLIGMGMIIFTLGVYMNKSLSKKNNSA